MERYRVPKVRVAVTVKLRGGLAIGGRVFLPPDPPDLPWTQKLRDLLNDDSLFVPLELGDSTPVVQNKASLLWCRYDGPVGPTIEILHPRRRVSLRLEDGTTLQGDLVADGPDDRRRVLDCLNGPEPFLMLEASDHDYLVRREAVTSAPSPEVGEERDPANAFELERAGNGVEG